MWIDVRFPSVGSLSKAGILHLLHLMSIQGCCPNVNKFKQFFMTKFSLIFSLPINHISFVMKLVLLKHLQNLTWRQKHWFLLKLICLILLDPANNLAEMSFGLLKISKCQFSDQNKQQIGVIAVFNVTEDKDGRTPVSISVGQTWWNRNRKNMLRYFQSFAFYGLR